MKLLTLFFVTIISMATFVVKTSHTGTLDGGVMPKEYYKQEYELFSRDNTCKVVMCNGDTIDYYAASKVRCDELYKYQHYIGVGRFLRTGELLHVYNPNSNKYFVTIEQLEKMYGQKVYFTDVYNCN